MVALDLMDSRLHARVTSSGAFASHAHTSKGPSGCFSTSDISVLHFLIRISLRISRLISSRKCF